MTSKKTTAEKATAPKPVSKTKQVTTVKREAKWRRLDVMVAAIAVSLISYSVWHNFLAKSAKHDTCLEIGTVETVSLSNDSFSPQTVQLSRCDQLKVVNNDSLIYNLAFGTHDKHVEYPGFSMQQLRPNEYFELDALQAGNYVMHDHLRDSAKLRVKISD